MSCYHQPIAFPNNTTAAIAPPPPPAASPRSTRGLCRPLFAFRWDWTVASRRDIELINVVMSCLNPSTVFCIVSWLAWASSTLVSNDASLSAVGDGISFVPAPCCLPRSHAPKETPLPGGQFLPLGLALMQHRLRLVGRQGFTLPPRHLIAPHPRRASPCRWPCFPSRWSASPHPVSTKPCRCFPCR